jgi:hypothetical protein
MDDDVSIATKNIKGVVSITNEIQAASAGKKIAEFSER